MLSSLSNNIELAKIEVEAIAKQIFNALDNPIKLGEQYFYQRISIGIRFFLNDKDDPNSILKQADIALYKAKQEGKNRFYFFDQQLQFEADQRLFIINELQHGLNNHQFLLHYQPIFNNNRLVAYEALLRLRNTNNKIQKSEQFIEIIEKSSLMIELGKYIFNEACQQLKKWQEQGFPKSFDHLSINISPNEFTHPDFTYFVKKTIKKHEVDPAYIMFEISENLMLNDIDLVSNKMKALQKLGLRFSLDDFGTGYSSLSYLRNLPFSELKIDKTFIKNIINDKKDRVLLSAIINMSNSLDLTVVIEGIENIEQKELLIDMGSCFFQGDLLGKAAEPKPTIL